MSKNKRMAWTNAQIVHETRHEIASTLSSGEAVKMLSTKGKCKANVIEITENLSQGQRYTKLRELSLIMSEREGRAGG